MKCVEFFVPGVAKPGGSKKGFVNPKTGQVIITNANPATKTWMDTVRWQAMKHVGKMCLLTDAICLKLTFLRARAGGDYGSGRNAGMLKASAPLHNVKTPDLTKLIRAVEDALTGVVWKDDKQVIAQRTNKRYCRGGEIPGVQIRVETVESKGVPDYGKDDKQGKLFRQSRRVNRDDGNRELAVSGSAQRPNQLYVTEFDWPPE